MCDQESKQTLRRKTFRSTGTTDVVAIVVKLGGCLHKTLLILIKCDSNINDSSNNFDNKFNLIHLVLKSHPDSAAVAISRWNRCFSNVLENPEADS